VQLRLEEQARAIALLTALVSSSRELIEAKDFEAGVLAWLGHLGLATDAIRATFYDFVVHEESGLKTWRMLKEWVREGVGNNIPMSFSEPYVIDPRGDAGALADWMTKDVVIMHVDEVSSICREMMEQQGHATSVGLPFRVNGVPWGAVSLDFLKRREPSDDDRALLRIAADSFATVLASRQAHEAALREREARAEAAERSNRELQRRDALLKAVAEGTRAFLQDPNFQDDLPRTFAKIGSAIGIHRIIYLEERGSGKNAAHHVASEWTAPGFDTHADHGLSVMPNDLVPSFDIPLRRGESVWSTLRELPDEAARIAFARLGVKSTGCVPIFVEGRYHGAICFDDCEEERVWNEAEITSLTALANSVAAALGRCRSELRALRAETEQAAERARGEHARQTAVQEERTRLAGVIHDTLAQGFVGVLLQLEAAEEARTRGLDELAEAQTEKARDLARFGLAEARRSALAIYPLGEAHNALEAALQNLAERVFVPDRFRCDFRRIGEPRPLGREVGEVLLRLANEGINNALRHGRASRILVELTHSSDATELHVIDNGKWRPCRPDQAGLGLRGLRDEIGRLGGTLNVGPRDTGGTVLAARLELARLPLSAPAQP
jgi:signal transduction histidine kinase